jgi:hypothetical protein
MADLPNKLYPGDGIVGLDRRDVEFLGSGLTEMIADLERMHDRYFKDIKTWWKWYEAIPRHETKNWPFRNASNLVVPLIQQQSLALINRLSGMVFSNDNRVWMARTENTVVEDIMQQWMRYQNWAANGNTFDLKTAIVDGLMELVPIGETVWALNWQRDERAVFTGGRGRDLQVQRVLFGRGPIVEHVPREQMLWDPAFRVADAPMVVRSLHLTQSDLSHRAHSQPKESGWILENIEKIQGATGLVGTAGEVTTAKEQDTDNMWRTASQDMHDIREVHIDFPNFKRLRRGEDLVLPGGQEPGHETLGLVFVVHRQSGLLLQAKAEPYNFAGKPFVDAYFSKRPGRGHSVGLCKKLQHPQSAATTLLNQALDSRTRANAVWAKTSSSDLADQELDPAHALFVPNGVQFEAFDLSKNVLNDVNLFNQVNIIAERLTGQADPLLGRESRSGGHPSPATSTLALLGQSDQMISTLRMEIRGAISAIGQGVMTMYQQFGVDPQSLVEVVGETDAALINEFLEAPVGAVRFDVVGMTQNSNPQAELQKAMSLMGANVNYWSFVAQTIQLSAQAISQGLPGIAEIAQQSLNSQTKLMRRLLAAGDIDDIEDFTLAIQRANSGSTLDAEELARRLGTLAPGQQPVQQPGVAGPAGPDAGGTVPTPGAIG